MSWPGLLTLCESHRFGTEATWHIPWKTGTEIFTNKQRLQKAAAFMEPSSGMLNKWKEMERKSCLELMSSMLSYSRVCFQVFVDFFCGLGWSRCPTSSWVSLPAVCVSHAASFGNRRAIYSNPLILSSGLRSPDRLMPSKGKIKHTVCLFVGLWSMWWGSGLVWRN